MSDKISFVIKETYDYTASVYTPQISVNIFRNDQAGMHRYHIYYKEATEAEYTLFSSTFEPTATIDLADIGTYSVLVQLEILGTNSYTEPLDDALEEQIIVVGENRYSWNIPIYLGFTFSTDSQAEWTTGTIYYRNSKYTIDAGDTTDAYVYFDPDISETVFQTSASRPALGENGFYVGYYDDTGDEWYEAAVHKDLWGGFIITDTLDDINELAGTLIGTFQTASVASNEYAILDDATHNVETYRDETGAVLKTRLSDRVYSDELKALTAAGLGLYNDDGAGIHIGDGAGTPTITIPGQVDVGGGYTLAGSGSTLYENGDISINGDLVVDGSVSFGSVGTLTGTFQTHSPATFTYAILDAADDSLKTYVEDTGVAILKTKLSDKVYTDEVRALTSAGLKLYEDGGSGIFVEDGGQVGIGTAAPTELLHVEKDQNTDTSIMVVNADAGVSAVARHVATAETANSALVAWSDAYILASVAGKSGLTVGNEAAFLSSGSGTGTFTFITRDSGFAYHERVKIDNDGNVGIGTTDPSSLLEVYDGQIEITRAVASTGYGQILFRDADATTWAIGQRDGDDDFHVYDNNNATDRITVLNASGNVGIGETDPDELLHVSSASNTGMQITGTSGDAFIRFVDTTTDKYKVGYDQSTDTFKIAVTNFNSKDLVVDNTGYIGINEDDPDSFLHITDSGSVDFMLETTGTEPRQWKQFVSGTTGHFYLRDQTGVASVFIAEVGTPANTLYLQGTTGNVGIGTNAPAEKLHVDLDGDGVIAAFEGTGSDRLNIGDDSNDLYLDFRNVDALAFRAQGTEYMRISNLGNVGIGTDDPDALLEISGDGAEVRITDTTAMAQGVGGYLSLHGNWYTAGITTLEFARIKAGKASGTTFESGSYLSFYNKITATGVLTERMRITEPGYVGIGTTDPSTLLEIASGAANSTLTIDSGVPAGSVYISQIALSDRGADAWEVQKDENNHFVIRESGVADRVTILDGGNVGIGTDAPEQALHVEGYMQFGNTPRFYSDDGAFTFLPTTGNVTGVINLYASGTQDKTQMIFYGGNLTSTDYVRMELFQDGEYSYLRQQAVGAGSNNDIRIQHGGTTHLAIQADGDVIVPAGNVGIGTTTPGITGNTQGLTISTGSTEGTAFLELQGKRTSGSGGFMGIDFYNQSSRQGIITMARNGSDTASDMMFFTANGSVAEAMRIDKDGNVGIGTDAPGAQLEVESAGENLRLTSTSGAGNPKLAFYQDVTERAYLRYADTGNIFRMDSDAQIDFSTVGIVAMTIDSSQNVGINNTDPQEKLFIDGNIGLDGSSSINMYQESAGTVLAKISSLTEGAGNVALAFYTTTDGGSSLPEALRIDSSQNVGIGDFSATAVGANLHILGDTNAVVEARIENVNENTTSAATFRLKQGTTSSIEGWLQASDESYTVAWMQNRFVMSTDTDCSGISIGARATAGDIQFLTGGSTPTLAMTIDSSQDITMAGDLDVGTVTMTKLVTDAVWAETSAGLTLADDSGTLGLVVEDGGYVGIGHNNPSAMLDIRNETTTASINLFSNTGGAGIGDVRIAMGTGGVTGTWAFGLDDSNSDAFTIANSNNDLSTNPRMVIETSGNVGIGTASPSGALTVQSGLQTMIVGADVNLTTLTNSVYKFARIGMPHYTNAEEPSAIIMGGSDSGENFVLIGGGSSAMNAVEEIRFYTAADDVTLTGTQRMVVDNSGAVGIGITDPSQTARGGKLVIQNDVDYSAVEFEDNATLVLNNETNGGETALVFHTDNATGSSMRAGITFHGITSSADSYIGFYGDIANKTSAADPDAVITGTGNVGINDTAPERLLHITDGNGTMPANAGGTLFALQNNDNTGDHVAMSLVSGTAGKSYIYFGDSADENAGTIWYDNNTNDLSFRTNALSAAMIIDNTGNITMAGDLTVTGDLDVNDLILDTLSLANTQDAVLTSYTRPVLYSTGGGGGAYPFNELGNLIISPALSGVARDILFITDSAGVDTAMTILESGNVGIGTTDPDGLFHAKLGASSALIEAGSQWLFESDATNYMQFMNPNTATPGILWGDPEDANAGGLFYSHSTNTFSFRTAGVANRVAIDGSGNVGIGTASPAGLLQLSGTASSLMLLTDAPNAKSIYFQQYGGTSYMGTDASTMRFKYGVTAAGPGTTGTTAMTIVNDGNVGIGTVSPAEPLEVSSPTTAFILADAAANQDAALILAQRGSYKWFLSNDGDNANLFSIGSATGVDTWNDYFTIAHTTGFIGVGTTTPDVMFEIASDSSATMAVTEYIDSASGPALYIRKARGTEGVPTIVTDDDQLGAVNFLGYDGSEWEPGAAIIAYIDGTPGAGEDMPTRLTFWTRTDGASTWDEKMQIDNDGNVGIGTTDPDEKLHVSGTGDTRIGISSTVGVSDAVLEIGVDIDSGNTWGLGMDSSNSNAFAIAYNAAGNPSLTGNNLITVLTNGNVGIGTDDPERELTVRGDVLVEDGGSLIFDNDAEDNWFYVVNTGAAGSSVLDFGTGKVVIEEASGRVGIGTTSPDSLLHVESSSTFAAIQITGAASDAFILFEDTTTSKYKMGYDQSIAAFKIAHTDFGNDDFVIDSSGNVGIGTDSPDALLDVAGASDAFIRVTDTNGGVTSGMELGAIEFYSSDASTSAAGVWAKIQAIAEDNHTASNAKTGLAFSTNTAATLTERMRIDEDGRVGIGTDDPSQALDVVGSVEINGDAFISDSIAVGALSTSVNGADIFGELITDHSTTTESTVLRLSRDVGSPGLEDPYHSSMDIRISRYATGADNAFTQAYFRLAGGLSNIPDTDVLRLRSDASVYAAGTFETVGLITAGNGVDISGDDVLTFDGGTGGYSITADTGNVRMRLKSAATNVLDLYNTGITVTGNITVTGTVDGVDVAGHVANTTTMHPSPVGQTGKVLSSNGSVYSWASSATPAAHATSHEGGSDPIATEDLVPESGSLTNVLKISSVSPYVASWDAVDYTELSNIPSSFTPASHATSHQNGESDEISVAGLSGVLADAQTPASHATSHQNGESDEINVAGLSGVLADAQTPASHSFASHTGYVSVADGGTNATGFANATFLIYDSGTTSIIPSGYDHSSFAVAAKGVTNGDSHDHVGGDGAAIVLTTAVSGTLPIANGGSGTVNFQHNHTSSTAQGGILTYNAMSGTYYSGSIQVQTDPGPSYATFTFSNGICTGVTVP